MALNLTTKYRFEDTEMRATMVVDMQFGSTGKGLIAGYIAETYKPDAVATAWFPNAGHTYIGRNGVKYVHCMLANGIVSPELTRVFIGPGSLLDIDLLLKEAFQCRNLVKGKTILIHECAGVVRNRHIEEEQGTMTGIGSTKKGCGAALADKIRRNTQPCGDQVVLGMDGDTCDELVKAFADLGAKARIVGTYEYQLEMESVSHLLIEGAQGYSLGINSGFYPYTTSRECTPAQIASDTLVPLPCVENIVGVMRTYPIRVANRYDEDGNQVGYSGPCYLDQRELEWSELGIEPELTTVTKLPRRIFTFSMLQAEQAIRAIRPTSVFLNFVNYLPNPAIAEDAVSRIDSIGHRICGTGGRNLVRYVGTGPAARDVYDLMDFSIAGIKGVWQ